MFHILTEPDSRVLAEPELRDDLVPRQEYLAYFGRVVADARRLVQGLLFQLSIRGD